MQCSVGAMLVPTPQSPLTITLPDNAPVKSAAIFSATTPFVDTFVMIKLPAGPPAPRFKGEPVTVIVAFSIPVLVMFKLSARLGCEQRNRSGVLSLVLFVLHISGPPLIAVGN